MEGNMTVIYRGEEFPGYNKPKKAPAGSPKKMRVLAKKGDKVKIVNFGQKGYEDFTQHNDLKRRENYLKRSAGIRNKEGKLTKDDKFSANYWARKELW
jgi:hypothetical protein